MSKKQNAAGDSATNRAARPGVFAFVAAIVICGAAVILIATAPAVFAAVGGWITVVVLLFLLSVWAGLAMVRNTNRNAQRTDDEPSA